MNNEQNKFDICWQHFEKMMLIPKDRAVDASLVLTRDDNYNLCIEIIFNESNDCFHGENYDTILESVTNNYSELVAKEPVFSDTEYIIKKIIITNKKTDNILRQVRYFGKVAEIYHSCFPITERKPNFVVYWFLNTSTRLAYTECFKSSEKGDTAFQWGNFDRDGFSLPDSENTSWNSIILTYQNYKFLFGQVRDDIDTKRSFIRFERNVFPPDAAVSEINTLLSYILGIELIFIGSTKFDSNSYPIEKYTYSTFQLDIEKVLAEQEIPPFPVRVEDRQVGVDICQQINTFIQNYLNTQERYNWGQILWYITYARTQPPLVKMQPLATAFDLICSQYFGGKNILLPQEIFSKILKNIKSIVDNATITDEEKEQLFGKISNCNFIGQNKKNRLIFDELKMELSKDEDNALKARNTSVHGSIGQIDIIQTMVDNNLFMTLFNRLVLKLLGIKYYIDYSKQGLVIAEVEKSQSGKYSPRKL
jgi:hypothetical protein